MAKIPTIDSNRQITTVAPTQRIAKETFTQPIIESERKDKSLTIISEAANRLALHFEEIHAENEATRADTLARRSLKELELEAETSEDLNPESFKERINKIGEDTSGSITSHRARNSFKSKYEALSLNYEYNIGRILNNRRNELAKITLAENLDEMGNEYINASSTAEQSLIASQMLERVDNRVRNGVLSPIDGEKIKANTLGSWKLSELNNDIENDPEIALLELNRGLEGKYGDIPLKDRKSAITTAEQIAKKRKAELEQAQVEMQTKNELDFSISTLNGEMDLNQVENLYRQQGISVQTARALREILLSSEAVNAKDDAEEVGSFVDKYLPLDESNLTELRKFRNDVLISHANGLLSRKTALELINKTVDPFTQKKAEKKGFILSAINAIKNFANAGVIPTPLPTVNYMIGNLLSRIEEKNLAKSDDIANEAQEIIKDTIRSDNPELIGLEDIPNATISTGNGIKSVFNGKSKQPVNIALPGKQQNEVTKGFIRMQIPSGEIIQIPEGNVEKAKALGAKEI